MQKIVWVAALVLALGMLPLGHGVWGGQPVYAADADGMAKVRLILKKLRSSMASMKDFDELEAAGMDKKDVDKLRRAMKAKIKQMTTDAVELISAL